MRVQGSENWKWTWRWRHTNKCTCYAFARCQLSLKQSPFSLHWNKPPFSRYWHCVFVSNLFFFVLFLKASGRIGIKHIKVIIIIITHRHQLLRMSFSRLFGLSPPPPPHHIFPRPLNRSQLRLFSCRIGGSTSHSFWHALSFDSGLLWEVTKSVLLRTRAFFFQIFAVKW